MQKVTAWAQDALGRILAEVEMTPVRSRQTSPAYWVDGRLEMEDAATGVVVSLGPSDHLTIRRRVHPGARLYVGRIAASLVEATWPLSGEKPVWAAEMRKQDGDWYIFVSMVRPGLVTALNHAAEAKGLTLEAITADRQTFPNPDTRRKWTDPTRLRLALIGALAAIAAAGPVLQMTSQLSGKAALEGLAATAVTLSTPARDALVQQRADAAASAALTRAAARPGLATLFDDLAAALPDDARLTSVSLEPPRLRLQGRGPSAAAVLAAFTDLKALSGVRFDGAVNTITGQGAERFAIIADLAGANGAKP